jgi:hypothetical protein
MSGYQRQCRPDVSDKTFIKINFNGLLKYEQTPVTLFHPVTQSKNAWK